MQQKIDWVEFDELEVAEMAAIIDSMDSEKTNSFKNLLAQGEKFKSAGLTPAYRYAPKMGVMEVYSEELSGKMLN